MSNNYNLQIPMNILVNNVYLFLQYHLIGKSSGLMLKETCTDCDIGFHRWSQRSRFGRRIFDAP